MAFFKTLYERKYLTLVCWEEIVDKKLLRSKLVQITTYKVKMIKERLKMDQDRQKSYVDNKKRPLKFEVCDLVFLQVTLWKNIIRFKVKGKLTPRYISPYKVLKKIEPIAYQLELPLMIQRCMMCSMCHYFRSLWQIPHGYCHKF